MKHIIIFFILAFVKASTIYGQAENVGIGTSSPDASAKLEIESNDQGLLVPRLSSAERENISNPAPGLFVFDKDIRTLFLFDGANWFPLAYSLDNISFPPSERSTGSITTSLGYRVDIDALGIVSSTDNGRVFFFNYEGGNYTSVEEVISSSADPVQERFGQSVAIHGNFMAIGAPGGGVDTGKVYLFQRVGNAWQEQQVLKNNADPIPGDGFGWSLAMDGDLLVVGSPFDDIFGNINEGSFSILRNVAGVYQSLLKTFQPIGSGFMPNDHFGWDVDVDGIYILVGAPGHSNREGKVYYYREVASIFNLDHQSEYRNFSDVPNVFYGYSVGIDSSFAVIGYPGASNNAGGYHIIGNFGAPEFGDEGPEFQQFYINTPSSGNANTFTGASVSANNGYFMVGTPHKLDPIYSSLTNSSRFSKVEIFSHGQQSGALLFDLINTWEASSRTSNGMGISTALLSKTFVAGYDEENRFLTKTLFQQ